MNTSACFPDSRKTATPNTASRRLSQSAPFVRVISKPCKVDNFERAQKKTLLQLRDSLVDSIAGVAPHTLRSRLNGNEAPVSVGDRADAGSDASQRDFTMILLSQEHVAFIEIEQALKRIESGTYGICEMSGQAIPRARLEALPLARYTVECQAQLEKERRASKSWARTSLLFEREIEEELALEPRRHWNALPPANERNGTKFHIVRTDEKSGATSRRKA